MRKSPIGFSVAVALVIVPLAAGDGVYQPQKYPFAPVALREHRTGFIENIHANGPIVYAHEQYVLRGAFPETTYDVKIHASAPADTTCASPILTKVTATFTTNPAGNGAANHVFTPTGVGPLRGATVHVYWTITRAATLPYTTGARRFSSTEADDSLMLDRAAPGSSFGMPPHPMLSVWQIRLGAPDRSAVPAEDQRIP